MGCKMGFYGLCSKVLLTFRTTYGSKMELHGPNSKVVMTFKNTHGMSGQWNYMDHIARCIDFQEHIWDVEVFNGIIWTR
jgi:hypothetical protein